jgi:hypothetical protein
MRDAYKLPPSRDALVKSGKLNFEEAWQVAPRNSFLEVPSSCLCKDTGYLGHGFISPSTRNWEFA